MNTPLMLAGSLAVAQYFLESPQFSRKTKLRWLQETNKVRAPPPPYLVFSLLC